jgi:hypothetical protein
MMLLADTASMSSGCLALEPPRARATDASEVSKGQHRKMQTLHVSKGNPSRGARSVDRMRPELILEEFRGLHRHCVVSYFSLIGSQ